MKTILILTSFLIGIFNTEAALMPHYKMDSFYLMADAVILCDETSIRYEKKEHHGGLITIKAYVTCENIKVFKGAIKKGGKMEISYDAVFSRSIFGHLGHVDIENPSVLVPPAAVPIGRALIFLKLKEKGAGYRVITAKLILKNGVFQFKQSSNPGPFVLFPQNPENVEMKKDGKYTEQMLLSDFALAREKSKHLKNPVSVDSVHPLVIPKK